MKQKGLQFHQGRFEVKPFVKDGIDLPLPFFKTDLGVLFEGDCLKILPTLQDECVNTVFADPPFNLNKKYGKKSDDNRPESEYLNWCYQWIDECIRVIIPGGSFFLSL